MKVGDYVRTDTGRIAKIRNIIDYGKDNEFEYLNYNDVCVLTTENDYNYDVVGCRGRIIKSSPNILELLEEHDFITIEYYSLRYDERVTRIFEVDYKDEEFTTLKNAYCDFMLKNNEFNDSDKALKPIIKSIVTKEQFESMEYRIGE